MPPTMTRQQELDKILEEAGSLQKKYDGKRWDPKDREKFDSLCAEGQTIQDELESEQKAAQLFARGRQLREVPDPTLPGAGKQGEEKGNDREIAGYVSVGDIVLASEQFRNWARNGFASGNHAIVNLTTSLLGKSVRLGPGGEALVPLNRKARQEYEAFLETKEAKAVPVLGAGVLEPARVDRIPQVAADDRLRMRDVLAGGSVSAASVEYVREEQTTGSPAETTHGSQKPEITIEYSLQSAPVRTIAGWTPVQKQQLEDFPLLRSLIDGRLRYLTQRREEQQLIFGNGIAPNIQGLAVVAGTHDIETNGRFNPGTHTLIDAVRMGITDVMVSGYEANAVVIHPVDWETILLEKGSDNRYVWAVVTDTNGARIWGVRVVEAVGAQSTVDGRRVFIVGDFRIGAQLLDRSLLTVQVGLIDKQFIENTMTILAEERVAFPIYAPAAFALFETQAAGS